MNWESLTRRKVLAALAGTGVASVAGLGVGTKGAVQYTSAQSTETCPGFTLNAMWRESYTRDDETTLLENTTAGSGEDSGEETTADEPGIIHLQNVLPGDRGTVSVRLTATNIDDGVTPEPELSVNIEEKAENGINNPEEKTGDTSENVGELQDFLSVKMWKDTGLLGIDALGADNLVHDFGEPKIGDGTLQAVADSVNDESLGTINSTGEVTVTLRWEFDPDVDPRDVNVTQGDSVTFELDIDCGGS